MVMVEKTDMTGEMDKINKTVQAERLKHCRHQMDFTCRESLNLTKAPL